MADDVGVSAVDRVDLDRVEDDETLYRSVWLKEFCFFLDEEGVLHVSAEAFADRQHRPSVFRRHLCDAPPYSNPPRLNPDNAVVSLTAGRVRETSPISHQSGKQPVVLYVIDIEPDINEGQHRSHAVVYANPAFPNSNAFAKLKLRLAQLVEEWTIPPDAAFIEQLKQQ